jgi:hypothetical protein
MQLTRGIMVAEVLQPLTLTHAQRTMLRLFD